MNADQKSVLDFGRVAPQLRASHASSRKPMSGPADEDVINPSKPVMHATPAFPQARRVLRHQ
jgi:hypothetical protein